MQASGRRQAAAEAQRRPQSKEPESAVLDLVDLPQAEVPGQPRGAAGEGIHLLKE